MNDQSAWRLKALKIASAAKAVAESILSLPAVATREDDEIRSAAMRLLALLCRREWRFKDTDRQESLLDRIQNWEQLTGKEILHWCRHLLPGVMPPERGD